VIFGGGGTDKSFENNVKNMKNALDDAWSGHTTSIQEKSQGTKADLWSMIDNACAGLNSDTQLVLYITGHGDTEIDWMESDAALIWYIMNTNQGFHKYIDLNSEDWIKGWTQGQEWMEEQPDVEPAAYIDIMLEGPVYGENWVISLNNTIIDLPTGLLSGELELPFDWTILQAGGNHLQIYAVGSPTYDMILSNFELSSGPIGDVDVIPEPATICLLGLGGLALIRRRKESAN